MKGLSSDMVFCSDGDVVCLECNGANSKFFINRFIALFYCYIMMFELFYYLGYLQQPRFEMCKRSSGNITIAFLIFAIRYCAEIILKESLSL